MKRAILGLAVVILGCLATPANLNAEDAADYVKSAKAWLDKEKYGNAIRDCDRAIAVDFQCAEAYNLRARLWILTGEFGKALDDCDEALTINPKFAEAYITRAHAWHYKHVYDKAIADCNQALAIDPKLAQAYSNRGDAWFEKGDIDKAFADCNKALALNPKLADAYFGRGLVWQRKGHIDKAIADWKQALVIRPDDWNTLNDLGVGLWMQAQDQDSKAAKAEADGDLKAAKASHEKSAALKKDAMAQWNHGITARPTATDIHSNLGYAYSESNDLDKAESHLVKAVLLNPISPRPRNNLGRVLLRRSQQLDTDARAAEAKGKTDLAEGDKAKQLRDAAKSKRDDAIAQFEKAVELDPTLLEAHLNLGEVFITLNELDKSEHHYREILKLDARTVTDREAIGNFSQAHFGLAKIALARKNVDEAIAELRKAIALNPRNLGALQLLATQHFLRGEYQEGEKHLWSLLAMLPKAQRRTAAEGFVGQFKAAGKAKEEVRACNFFAWAFATGPQDNLLDPEAALAFAKHVAVDLTKEQDPTALDTLAAAQAANGKYKEAVQSAQAAIKLANSQGNKPLSDAISARLQLYQKEKPYRYQLDGSDRP